MIINVPYNLIYNIAKPERIKLAIWCNRRYKQLSKRHLNNAGMLSFYHTLTDTLIDSSSLEDDTEILPNNSLSLIPGIDLKEELLISLNHSQLFLGTDNYRLNNHFRNIYETIINHLNLQALYVFDVNQGISSVKFVTYNQFLTWLRNVIIALNFNTNK